MKRVLAFLLALLMLTACAYADETAEITYQGIPWGSSVETVKKWVKQQGFKSVLDTSGILTCLDAECKHTFKIMEGVKNVIAQSDSAFQFQAAGYDVRELYFCFDTVGGKPALATVHVTIDPKYDKEQTLDDLEQKLIQVYGENECEPAPTQAPNSIFSYSRSGYTSSRERYIKRGANNTAVCLSKSYGMKIVYGKTDAFADPEEPTITVSPFNLGGL
ncbi:MAG: hypothetical protein IKW00_08090 [Clostridia bacterium]|nr:hypothetical protein [Clostridia bacterium]